MANTFLTNTYEDNYTDVTPVITTTPEQNLPKEAYDNKVHSTYNNYRICKLNNDIDCPDTTPVVTTVEILPIDPGEYTLNRTLNLTYETLYKNIASYDSNTDMVNSRYFIKTYFLPDNKTIKVITDMETVGIIVSSISGDTGFDNVLVKTTTYVKNIKVDVAYTLGGLNG